MKIPTVLHALATAAMMLVFIGLLFVLLTLSSV